jgi:O-antigen ligase
MLLAAAPFVLAFVVICLREPLRIALPVFAFLIPFGKGLNFGSNAFGSVSSLMGLLLAGGLALQLVTTRPATRRLSLTVPLWVLFLATAAASALWTIDRGTSIAGLQVLGSLILVYVLVALSKVDRTVVRRTEDGLLAGGIAAVCYGLYQLIFLGGFPEDLAGNIGPSGRFGNDLLGPGVEAVALLYPLALALSRAFAGRQVRVRALYALAAALLFAGVLMTGSRTGTIASGLVIVALALSGPRQARRGLVLTFVVGLVAATLVWTFQPGGVATRTYASATSSSGRTDIWRVGIAACSDYCLFGSGWGTFPDVYAQTQASVPGARVLVGEGGSYQPHNLWLLAVVELGVAGLLLFTLALAVTFWEALRLPPGRRGPPFSALVGLTFAVFFLSSMEFKFFWMILIMVAINRNAALDEEVTPPDLPVGDARTPSSSTPGGA